MTNLSLRFKTSSHTEPEVLIDYTQVEGIILVPADHNDGSPGVRLNFTIRSGARYEALPTIKKPDAQFFRELGGYLRNTTAGCAVYEEFLDSRAAVAQAAQ